MPRQWEAKEAAHPSSSEVDSPKAKQTLVHFQEQLNQVIENRTIIHL